MHFNALGSTALLRHKIVRKSWKPILVLRIKGEVVSFDKFSNFFSKWLKQETHRGNKFACKGLMFRTTRSANFPTVSFNSICISTVNRLGAYLQTGVFRWKSEVFSVFYWPRNWLRKLPRNPCIIKKVAYNRPTKRMQECRSYLQTLLSCLSVVAKSQKCKELFTAKVQKPGSFSTKRYNNRLRS